MVGWGNTHPSKPNHSEAFRRAHHTHRMWNPPVPRKTPTITPRRNNFTLVAALSVKLILEFGKSSIEVLVGLGRSPINQHLLSATVVIGIHGDTDDLIYSAVFLIFPNAVSETTHLSTRLSPASSRKRSSGSIRRRVPRELSQTSHRSLRNTPKHPRVPP
jgi:hypothetical protein